MIGSKSSPSLFLSVTSELNTLKPRRVSSSYILRATTLSLVGAPFSSAER